MKKLYLALLVTLTTAFVLTGCSGCNTETVEETTENITSEEVTEGETTSETEENSEKEETTETEVVSEEVEESTENVTPEEEEITSETEENSEVVEETTESETEVKEETQAYTVTDMEKTMYAQRSVNVRTGPTTDYEKLGALNTNDEVKVTGQADNGWYRIEYNGSEGFVSNNYLGDTKVVVNNTPSTTPTDNGTTTPATPSTPTVDTTNVPSRVINGATYYAFRTTANGTPIYDSINAQWPQYIVDVINECCTPGMSDLEKATAIYNWLTANVSYDNTHGSYTTKSTLSTRTATCTGYANAYQSLCCAVGITGSVIDGAQGPSQVGHAWNFTYINGTRYFVDATQQKPPTTKIDTSTTNEYGQTVMLLLDNNGNPNGGSAIIYYECWDGLYDEL